MIGRGVAAAGGTTPRTGRNHRLSRVFLVEDQIRYRRSYHHNLLLPRGIRSRCINGVGSQIQRMCGFPPQCWLLSGRLWLQRQSWCWWLARLQWWLASLFGCLAQDEALHGHVSLPSAHRGGIPNVE